VGLSLHLSVVAIMSVFTSLVVAATCLLPLTAAYGAPPTYGSSNLTNAKTSLTLLYQNNLNASDDANHVGAILLDSMNEKNGAAACAAIGETLLSRATIQAHATDFSHSLGYLAYAGRALPRQSYYINNGILSVTKGAHSSSLSYPPSAYGQKRLPVLCTQSSNGDNVYATASASNQVTILSSGNTFVGFRNQKSFRFQGIPYAVPPERFEYSTVYNQRGKTINATAYGPDCTQGGDSNDSENCLFANIQTPYIPKAGSKEHLRPVLFSIHGGGFTGGSGGPNSGEDGGNFASREDIVSVEINYRLSTLGFLAIPGTDIKGNYGIGDQVTALKVRCPYISLITPS
jgi:hypothetical protein